MTKLLGLPLVASQHGDKVDLLILWVHYLMGVLFIGWFAYFLLVIFKFRQSKNPKASYLGAQTHASTYIEVAVVIVEMILLMGLSIPLWAKFADDFPKGKDVTEIRVVAEQFAWHALYPGPDGAFARQDMSLVSSTNQYGKDFTDPKAKDDFEGNLNEMVVPVGLPVIAHITSKDVIHSFKVNPLRVTQDAIPGLSIPIWFTPTKTGEYLINCAQLCGNSHYFMKGFFRVVTTNEYAKWMGEKTKAAAASAGGFE